MSGARHRKKFMGGRASPEQVHSDLAFPPGVRCSGCSGPRPIMRAVVMAPLDEVRKRDPDFEQLERLALISPEAAQRFHSILVMLKDAEGKPAPHLRLSTAYSCASCASSMEKALAKGPSWVVVDINRGPGPDRVVTSG